MQERSGKDRRKKNIRVEDERRRIKRRKEDIANLKSYYWVLGISLGVLGFMGTISFIWGR